MSTSPFSADDFTTDPFGPPPRTSPRQAGASTRIATPAPRAREATRAPAPARNPEPRGDQQLADRRPAPTAATRSPTPARPVVAASPGPEIVAATDGSSRGNPGRAGAAWFVDPHRWGAVGVPHATNNWAELTAIRDVLVATAAAGLAASPLHILSDSKYAISALVGLDGRRAWVLGWRRNGWKTSTGGPVANRDLIEEICALMRGRNVRFTWVRGHNGHPLNEAVDARATAAADEAGRVGKPVTVGPGWSAW